MFSSARSNGPQLIVTYGRREGVFDPDLENLADHGCTGIRVIFKNLELPALRLRLSELRKKISSLDRKFDLLLDLPGSKPVLGEKCPGIELQEGERFQLSLRNDPSHVVWEDLPVIPLSGFTQQLGGGFEPGVLLAACAAPFMIGVEEPRLDQQAVLCKAIRDLTLSEGMAINSSAWAGSLESLTDRDLEALEDDAVNGLVDGVMISFASSPQTILQAQECVGKRCGIVAKIETPLDGESLRGIIAAADAILIGRSDLFTFCDPAKAFARVGESVALSRAAGVPAVVGSGLLESLATESKPSIAEVMDVQHLLSVGADGFLVNGEPAKRRPIASLDALTTLWHDSRGKYEG